MSFTAVYLVEPEAVVFTGRIEDGNGRLAVVQGELAPGALDPAEAVRGTVVAYIDRTSSWPWAEGHRTPAAVPRTGRGQAAQGWALAGAAVV